MRWRWVSSSMNSARSRIRVIGVRKSWLIAASILVRSSISAVMRSRIRFSALASERISSGPRSGSGAAAPFRLLGSLVGGGSEPRPGEISLAHNGVLFLDELPEWDRRALEVLREPLESGLVTISRAARQSEFPARFQLVAAMNPCPCGWAGDTSGRCRCAPDAVRRYRSRISGPLLDRIDLHVEVPRLPAHELRPDAPEGEASASIRARVEASRALQQARSGRCNAQLDQAATTAHCRLRAAEQQLLERAIESLQLSARAMHRILRVARTIADLDGSADILAPHLAEALTYRGFTQEPVAAVA